LRLLLDTHLLLWWLEASPSLPAQAREMICDPENTVFVSAVSLWEIWLKQSLGKLRLPVDFTGRTGRRILREPATDGLADPADLVTCVVSPRSF